MLAFRTTFILILLLAQTGFAQQNKIWYFGKKAGINFNGARPVALHNSAMDAEEGSASICDNAGNLLFYTNGVTVFNKNHQVMVNGNGLAGNLSSVQAALIVPMPGNPSIYYIFITDAVENSFANGYTYSVVDMSQDNGKGQVISKNNLFHASATERLTGARHADGTSVWIITNDRNSNVFRSWLFDCNGFNTNPVVSAAGAVLNGHGLMGNGMMKVSPDGKTLCQTHYPFLDDGSVQPNYFQLFDFDNLTGIISNPRTIDPGDAAITSCEFSPNSKLLYISRAYDKKVDQYDISFANPISVVASRYTLPASGEPYYGIQLAPDQKIYLASPSPWLASISYPDVRGQGCTFQEKGFDVNEQISGSAYAGMPNFINDLSYDGSNNFSYTILDSCTGRVQFYGNTSMQGNISWNWDFGDGNSSGQQNPVHSFSPSSDSYTVKLKISNPAGCGAIERSRMVIPKGLLLAISFKSKTICDSGIIRFTNTSSFLPDTARIRYEWDFGDGNTSSQKNPVHNYSPGSYTARLTIKTTTACLDKSVTQPVVMQFLNISAGPDWEIETGQTAQLNATGGGEIYLWAPATGLSNPTVQNPVAKPGKTTTYVVTARNSAGCTDTDTVLVKVKPIPGIHVPTGFTPNNDGKNDVLRPYINDDYTLHEFAIFNRWGQKIYSTAVKETGWNGKINGLLQNPGVYVWIITVTDTLKGTREERKGSFILIR